MASVTVHIPELDCTLEAEFAIVGPEAASYHRRLLREQPESISPGIRELLAIGTVIPSSHHLKELRARLIIRDALRSGLADHDLNVMVTPTLPATAVRADQQKLEFEGMVEDVTSAYVRTTAPFNLSGQPALSIPCGFDADSLPIGLQTAGRPFNEATILLVGTAYETATPWAEHRPPIHIEAP